MKEQLCKAAIKCSNHRTEPGDYDNYQTEFTVDQITRLEEIKKQLEDGMKTDQKLVEEREQILRQVGKKRFAELWNEYINKAVYVSDYNFYGRVIGLEMNYDGSVRYLKLQGFIPLVINVNDCNRPLNNCNSKNIISNISMHIDEVEFITDETYNHEAEKYVKSFNDYIIRSLEDIRYDNYSNYNECMRSSGLEDYPEVRYEGDPCCCGEQMCCNDEPLNRF